MKEEDRAHQDQHRTGLHCSLVVVDPVVELRSHSKANVGVVEVECGRLLRMWVVEDVRGVVVGHVALEEVVRTDDDMGMDVALDVLVEDDARSRRTVEVLQQDFQANLLEDSPVADRDAVQGERHMEELPLSVVVLSRTENQALVHG